MFKKGDKVRCLRDCNPFFTKNKIYIVREDCILGCQVEKDDEGKKNGWDLNYFELTITPKVGGVYITRSGAKAIVETYHPENTIMKFGGYVDCFGRRSWTEHGAEYKEEVGVNDLVSEWDYRMSTNTELSSLISKANEGTEAVKILQNNYGDQIEISFSSFYPGWQLLSNNTIININFRKKQLNPICGEFTTSTGYSVTVLWNELRIGCKYFKIEEVKRILEQALDYNESKINMKDDRGKYHITRNGIGLALNMNERISWEDAEKILDALKKAG